MAVLILSGCFRGMSKGEILAFSNNPCIGVLRARVSCSVLSLDKILKAALGLSGTSNFLKDPGPGGFGVSFSKA